MFGLFRFFRSGQDEVNTIGQENRANISAELLDELAYRESVRERNLKRSGVTKVMERMLRENFSILESQKTLIIDPLDVLSECTIDKHTIDFAPDDIFFRIVRPWARKHHIIADTRQYVNLLISLRAKHEYGCWLFRLDPDAPKAIEGDYFKKIEALLPETKAKATVGKITQTQIDQIAYGYYRMCLIQKIPFDVIKALEQGEVERLMQASDPKKPFDMELFHEEWKAITFRFITFDDKP